MKKIIKGLLCLFLLIGCSSSKQESIDVDLDVYLFYLDTCQHCQAFKEIAVPALEEEFKDHITFHYVNMDFDGNNEIYDLYTDKLEDYHEDERLVPFIVVDGYFAILMYNEGEEKTLIKDIKAAINGEELSDLFKNERWIFKEEYHA